MYTLPFVHFLFTMSGVVDIPFNEIISLELATSAVSIDMSIGSKTERSIFSARQYGGCQRQ